MLMLVILCVLGLLAFFKPILLYRGMKNGGNGVSPLNLFTMGAVYIALAFVVIKIYYAKFQFSLLFAIILVLLGLWNIYFGILVKKLKPEPEDDAKEDDRKDGPETKT